MHFLSFFESLAPWQWLLLSLAAVLLLLFVYDVLQRRLPILHNFPLIGHIRYLLILIGPEMRQYVVAANREERPFNRSHRQWIDRTAMGKDNYFGFGTDARVNAEGYIIIQNAAVPHGQTDYVKYIGSAEDENVRLPCAKTMGAFHQRKRPYQAPSIINISGMSYGALSSRAVTALNKGAKMAGCYQNTGEGGFSPYHAHGADVILQMGTGKFGFRFEDNSLDYDRLVKLIEKHHYIRAIEIKMSQGAKPGLGGILPANKVTAEIAEIRELPVGETCVSPNHHKEFRTPAELIAFVEKVAAATGLPVGIKTALGKEDFFEELAHEMKHSGRGIDFITIDGGEGGTGAAPLVFADHVALPFMDAFATVYQVFQKAGLADRIVFIGSGRLGLPHRAAMAMALGCDMINVAREAMISIGCIQAQRCHTNGCPSGVATHNKWLERGLAVEYQSQRFRRYLETARNDLAALTHAAGHPHPCQLNTIDVSIGTGEQTYRTLKEIYGYEKEMIPSPIPLRT